MRDGREAGFGSSGSTRFPLVSMSLRVFIAFLGGRLVEFEVEGFGWGNLPICIQHKSHVVQVIDSFLQSIGNMFS